MSGAEATTAAAAAPSGRQEAPAAGGPPAEPQDISGIWIKDRERSDGPDVICEILELGQLFRMVMLLMKGLEVRVGPEHFEVDLLSGVLWFRVRERFPLSGERVQHSRRDRRPGMHTAWVERHPASGGWIVRGEWGEPLAGSASEHYFLHTPNELHKHNTVTVGGRTITHRAVFRRQE